MVNENIRFFSLNKKVNYNKLYTLYKLKNYTRTQNWL